MTNYNRKLPIKDALYGYTHFTVFEREIINHPLFQRLQFVLQNSTVYVAFPNNKNSRFVHSLGVSEIAGKLFQKSISNASSGALQIFLSQVAELFDHLIPVGNRTSNSIPELEKSWERWIRNASQFARHPFFFETPDSDPVGSVFRGFRAEFLINTCWLATKICGLVHDIGHLPMSHSFEHGLLDVLDVAELYGDLNPDKYRSHLLKKLEEVREQSIAENSGHYIDELANLLGIESEAVSRVLKNMPIHEVRSLMILDYIRYTGADIIENRASGIPYEVSDIPYRNLVLRLATTILFSAAMDNKSLSPTDLANFYAKASRSALRMMKSIVAGEVDADRLDYVTRDGISCGTDIGRFDLERIINNAVLVERSEGVIAIGFYHRAVGGIEQFFQERYEGYKYLIYHRTAVRSEAALRELIARIFHYSYLNQNSDLTKILVSAGYLSYAKRSSVINDILPADINVMVHFDDSSFRSTVSLIWRHIVNSEGDFVSEHDEILLRNIRLLSEIFLVRAFGHIYSPFSKGSLEQSLYKVFLGDNISREEMIERKGKIARLMRQGPVRSKIFKSVREKARGIPDEVILPVLSYYPPKVFDLDINNSDPFSSVILVDEEKEIHDIQEYSRMLREMPGANASSECFSISFVGENIKKTPSMMALADRICSDMLIDIWNLCDKENDYDN